MATKNFFAKLQANPSLASTIVKKKEAAPPAHKKPEEQQNALLRKVNAVYFRQSSAPIDPRCGLDMRTMCPSQDPSYLEPRSWNTYVLAFMYTTTTLGPADAVRSNLVLQLRIQLALSEAPLRGAGRQSTAKRLWQGDLPQHLLRVRGRVVGRQDARQRQAHPRRFRRLRGRVPLRRDNGHRPAALARRQHLLGRVP